MEDKYIFETVCSREMEIVASRYKILSVLDDIKSWRRDLSKGYDEAWIQKRIKGMQDIKQLTDVWKDGDIKEGKESLRDNMSDIEVTLADLGELATREIAKRRSPKGLNENIEISKQGGSVAKNARLDLESKIGESVISIDNVLNYEYENDNNLLKDKNI